MLSEPETARGAVAFLARALSQMFDRAVVSGAQCSVCRCFRVDLSCGGAIGRQPSLNRQVSGGLLKDSAADRVEDDVERRTRRPRWRSRRTWRHEPQGRQDDTIVAPLHRVSA
jgi:hypothetical protein